MTDNQMDNVEYQEVRKKKTNTTLWIILGVLAVVIICCCVLAVIGSFLYVPTWANQMSF